MCCLCTALSPWLNLWHGTVRDAPTTLGRGFLGWVSRYTALKIPVQWHRAVPAGDLPR